eukprot:GILI01005343.1.p1 GENE.GILI01005343.1~~GILI01005343.1.p1  ORF type:complete len:792 (-),score=139.52 GILI01005343.1:533-2908(-)
MSLAQCLSFSLLLAANAVTNLNIPLAINFDLSGTTIGLTNVRCPLVNGGSTSVYYNTSGISIEVNEAMNMTCEIDIDINQTKSSTLVVELTSVAGEALTIATIPDPNMHCYSSNASMTQCTLAPKISALRLSPPDSTLDFLLDLIGGYVNSQISTLICKIGADITQQITNTTMLPPSPFPPLRPGALPIQDWTLGKVITNIVQRLPIVFGAKIDIDEPTTTGLELNITMEDALNISTEALSVYTPPDVILSVDLGMDMLVCDDAALDCTVSNGIKLPNIRTYGGGQTDRLMNNYISPLLSSIVDSLFAKDGVKMDIPSEDSQESPPTFMIIIMGPAMAVLAAACVGYSIHRHTRNPIHDIHGNPLSITRVIMEDVFVTGMCFTCIYLFAWSNATTAASVVVGDELTVYTFSLVNSVRGMWQAGLYPLSILIALFSGVYPYVKLLTIVTFSVILQQPQNKFLRLIDNIGKFSFLDTFVMTILKTGLEINGIATVKCHVSFYIFLFATVGSVFIGNYATHGWRRQTQVRYDDNERELLVQRTSVNKRLASSKEKRSKQGSDDTTRHVENAYIGLGFGANYDSAAEDSTTSDPMKYFLTGTGKGLEGIDALKLKWYDVWEWQLAIPFGILMLVMSCVACYYPNVTYHISGFATILTGNERSSSMWELFIACDPMLLTAGLFTVVFAPFAYVVTYPHCRFLAAWGATDVFLLACVAALLQLEQFISFTLGEGMQGLYSASCSLQWPLILWTLSMFIQWFFVFKQTLGIPGLPTLSKIKIAMAIRDGDSSIAVDDK